MVNQWPGKEVHGSDFAATTVLSGSPRRDWNGRLRTTWRTSVWNPYPDVATFPVMSLTVGRS